MRPKEEFNRSNPNFNTLAVNPIQDFSPAVADKMDLARDVEYGDTRREYLRKADRIASGELDPDVIPRGYNRDLYANVFVRKAEDLAASERARQSMPENIMGMPSVMRLVNNAKRMGTDLTEADIRNLADWSMVNDAADIFVAAYQAGDPNAPKNIINSLAETNKYAAFMLPDIVEEKLRATVDDPTIVDTIVETAGKYIGDLLSPYFAAWEWTQRGVAAGNYRAARSNLGETPLSWVALAQGFASPSDRDATDPGSLNEEYIAQLAEAKNPDGTPVYTPLQIEIATDIVKLQAQGDPDPRKTLWGSKYAGNLQAQEIFTDLAFNRGDGTMQELMRQVMSADMSNVGQSFFGSSLTDLEYDPARGSEWRKGAADATGLAVGLIFDPTNLAFGAGRAFQAARWSLTRLAPNAETAAAAVLKGPAGRYFTRFTQDMNKLESMYAAADAAETAGQASKAVRLRASAAEHRAGMSNRYNAMPEQLIEDFRVEMPRNADGVFDLNSVVEWIDSTNAAFRTAVGEAAPQFVAVGAADAAKRAALMKVLDDPEALAPAKQEAQDALLQLNQETEAAIAPLRTGVQEALDKTFYGRVADTAQRREPLIPRLYAPGLLRQYAVNALRIGQASPLTIDRMIGKYFPNLSDPEKFADDLIENGQSLGAEVREFRAGAAMNPLTGPADSARRMFSSLPDVGVLSLSDASSTRAFYRYARQFFPKRMARLMAEQWRLGTPGSRRKMMTGVVRSAAAVRGIELSRLEVDELLDNGVTRMTGYRPGEQYGVKIAGPLLPSERAGLAAAEDATYPVYRVDTVENGLNWDKPQGLYMSAVDDAAKSPHRGFLMEEAGGQEKIVEFQGRVRQSDVFDVAPVEVPTAGLRGSAEAPPTSADAGVGYVLGNMADGNEWFAIARNGDGKTMSSKFRAKLQEFDPTVNWDQYYDNYERLMAVGGIQARRDGHKAIRMVDQDYLKYKEAFPDWEDLTEIVVLDRSAIVSSADSAMSQGTENRTLQLSLSADRNGVEHALHLEDTATQVRAPQLREFEELRRYGSLAEQGYYWTGRGLEGATNFMSFFTLFGLKFGLRNAIEEDGLFLFMGGSPVMLSKGRAADQALRRARPRLKPEIKIKDGAYTVVEKDGIPQIARKSSLGMIANKAEWLSLRLAEAGFPRWLTEFVYNSVDKETAYAAARAHAAGDGEAFSRLVVQSQVAHKLGGRKIFSMLSSDDMDGVGVLAESQHGMQLYDEIGESGGYLQNAGFPAFVIDSESINGAAPGIGWGKLSSQSNLKFGDYTNVAPVQIDQNTGKKILGASFWWDQLRKTLTTDGPIGEAAVRLLDKPIEAKAEIARIIREDTEFGYKEKLSRITDDLSIDEYANAYFENVFQHFTKSDGSLNLDLRARFMDTNPDTGLPVATFWQAADDLGEGMQTYRVPLSGLTDIPVADRPQFVFGREVQESTWIPVVETQAGLFQKGFNWLGRQNARLSRNPIFIANYLEQWRQTFPLRRSLANELAAAAGREAPSEADFLLANQLYGKKAMDSAYSLTLSYVDNPANRSNLAWKARNLARYYRASEDFWRRMKRVAVNKPETFWRAALTYSLLEDTSFTFRDDNGDLYFAYPGNSQMQQATAWFLDTFTGNKTYQFTNFDPFMMSGRVLGLAPSTDPNQQLPTFFGPTSVALTAIYDLFPALYKMKGLQKLTLGNYSNITGNTAQDVIAAATPPFIDRIINTLDPEQLDASLAQSGIGVITIMAASGMDTVTIEGKKYPLDQVTAEQFRQSEEYRAGQTLSLANFIVKTGMSVWAPAAPRVMSNDVSDEARDLGITGMKPLFRSMIDDYAEQGYSDPWGAAWSEWATLKLQEDVDTPGGISVGAYLPFTLSSYTSPSNTSFENTAALASLKNASKELLAFYGKDSTQDLINKGFKLGTFFLAPKSGEFDWTAWNLVKNDLGLRVPKTEDQMIEDFLALDGGYRDMLIRSSYSSYIDDLDPNDPNYRDQRRFYTDEMEFALKQNKNLNPTWAWKSGQGTNAFAEINYRAGFSEVNNMTKYILQRDGVLSGTALALRTACDIYLAYQPRIDSLTGTSGQRKAQEAALNAEMTDQLNAIKEFTPDSAPFIDNILMNLSYDPSMTSVFGEPNG